MGAVVHNSTIVKQQRAALRGSCCRRARIVVDARGIFYKAALKSMSLFIGARYCIAALSSRDPCATMGIDPFTFLQQNKYTTVYYTPR
jgi:hypothetical protein